LKDFEMRSVFVIKDPSMKYLRFNSFITAIVALGAFALSVRADENKTPAPEQRPLISLDFPGGTISDLIVAIEKADGGRPINVIGDKTAFATEVQAFSVRNADRFGVIEAISRWLDDRQGVVFRQTGDGIFLLEKVPSPQHLLPNGESTFFASFQLNPFLSDTQTVDDIVGAIRAAWELDPDHDPAALRIKFHPPTGLLLIAGPPEASTITYSVLKNIKIVSKSQNPPPQ
jgi:hypothetical protein